MPLTLLGHILRTKPLLEEEGTFSASCFFFFIYDGPLVVVNLLYCRAGPIEQWMGNQLYCIWNKLVYLWRFHLFRGSVRL